MRYLTYDLEKTVFKTLRPNTKGENGPTEEDPIEKKKFQKLMTQKINDAVKLNDLCIYL
jgi:hypothetical protein